MRDSYGREITYMRISITDRCNLRCRYCMPEGVKWLPAERILRAPEIGLICREAAALGIDRFKITGGEPLVRRDCPDLIRSIKAIPGVRQVTMTTNGILLGDCLEQLKDAGLDAVNVSLDTLRADTYRDITGFAGLDRVLDSIRRAVGQGFPVKINVVLQQGVNEAEWRSLAELAKKDPVDVRFIEMMPIGSGRKSGGISNTRLLAEVKKTYEAEGSVLPDEGEPGNGPAVYYRVPGFRGRIGFISAIHGKFCDKCNRIRLTAEGEIKPCLCFGRSVSVREAARRGDAEAVRSRLREAVERKPEMHCFEIQEEVTEEKKMSQIGG